MKTVYVLLIAVLLAVTVIGCGTFNGVGRDLEGLGGAMRGISQPAVKAQEEARIAEAILLWQEENGPVARR